MPVNCAADTVPLRLLALPAQRAYGTGISGWRGDSVLKWFAPVVFTAISSQLPLPIKAPGPKSMVVVKRPLLTVVAEFVSGPAMTPPAILVGNKVNARSKRPLAGAPPLFRRP